MYVHTHTDTHTQNTYIYICKIHIEKKKNTLNKSKKRRKKPKSPHKSPWTINSNKTITDTKLELNKIKTTNQAISISNKLNTQPRIQVHIFVRHVFWTFLTASGTLDFWLWVEFLCNKNCLIGCFDFVDFRISQWNNK